MVGFFFIYRKNIILETSSLWIEVQLRFQSGKGDGLGGCTSLVLMISCIRNTKIIWKKTIRLHCIFSFLNVLNWKAEENLSFISFLTFLGRHMKKVHLWYRTFLSAGKAFPKTALAFLSISASIKWTLEKLKLRKPPETFPWVPTEVSPETLHPLCMQKKKIFPARYKKINVQLHNSVKNIKQDFPEVMHLSLQDSKHAT